MICALTCPLISRLISSIITCFVLLGCLGAACGNGNAAGTNASSPFEPSVQSQGRTRSYGKRGKTTDQVRGGGRGLALSSKRHVCLGGKWGRAVGVQHKPSGSEKPDAEHRQEYNAGWGKAVSWLQSQTIGIESLPAERPENRGE